MTGKSNISTLVNIRKIAVFTVLSVVSIVVFGSMGGEKKKKSSNRLTSSFNTIRTTSGFTLKAGPVYKGSMINTQERSRNHFVYSSLVTFQKGNTTYILPYNSRVHMATGKSSNMEILKVKVPFRK